MESAVRSSHTFKMPPVKKKRRTDKEVPKFGGKNKSVVEISPRVFKNGRNKCRSLIKKLRLTIPKKPIDIFEAVPNTLQPATKRAYVEKWKEMARFFYMIGCYQSAMLVDREICPTKPLPFRPESYALYISYRMSKPGIKMYHPSTLKPVKDVLGKHVKTVGGWNSPTTCYKVRSAVLFLHEVAYPSTCSGTYVQACPECQHLNNVTCADLRADKEQDEGSDDAEAQYQNISCKFGYYKSCPKHANSPPLRSKGNVLNHPVARNTYVAWLRIKQNSHVVKGCGQLYPKELRALRQFLLLKGDAESYQMWVMVLLGVRLFLRCEELTRLDVDMFVNSYYPKGKEESGNKIPVGGENALTRCQVVHPDSIQALACEIMGKTDKRPHRLCLFTDEEHSDFDELTHLLWYMKIFNIRGGYLFPPTKVLEKQLIGGSQEALVCETHIKYQDFAFKFKVLVKEVIGRDEKIFLVGTHTLRKTAYLMAIWGYYHETKENSDSTLPSK